MYKYHCGSVQARAARGFWLGGEQIFKRAGKFSFAQSVGATTFEGRDKLFKQFLFQKVVQGIRAIIRGADFFLAR